MYNRKVNGKTVCYLVPGAFLQEPIDKNNFSEYLCLTNVKKVVQELCFVFYKKYPFYHKTFKYHFVPFKSPTDIHSKDFSIMEYTLHKDAKNAQFLEGEEKTRFSLFYDAYKEAAVLLEKAFFCKDYPNEDLLLEINDLSINLIKTVENIKHNISNLKRKNGFKKRDEKYAPFRAIFKEKQEVKFKEILEKENRIMSAASFAKDFYDNDVDTIIPYKDDGEIGSSSLTQLTKLAEQNNRYLKSKYKKEIAGIKKNKK